MPLPVDHSTPLSYQLQALMTAVLNNARILIIYLSVAGVGYKPPHYTIQQNALSITSTDDCGVG